MNLVNFLARRDETKKLAKLFWMSNIIFLLAWFNVNGWISTIRGDFFMIEHLRVATIVCYFFFEILFCFCSLELASSFYFSFDIQFSFFSLSVVPWLPVNVYIYMSFDARECFILLESKQGIFFLFFHSVYCSRPFICLWLDFCRECLTE